MFRFLKFPALIVISAAALWMPVGAAAKDRRDYDDRGYYGDRDNRHEYREHKRHEEREWREERRERERREEWRERERRESRDRYRNGYYDRFGYWHYRY